jgi:hypothetical protein
VQTAIPATPGEASDLPIPFRSYASEVSLCSPSEFSNFFEILKMDLPYLLGTLSCFNQMVT